MRHSCVGATGGAQLVQVMLVIYLGGGCRTLSALGLGLGSRAAPGLVSKISPK